MPALFLVIISMKRKIKLKDNDFGVTIKVESDLTDVVEAVKANNLENPLGWTKKKQFRKVASIPLDIILSLSKEEQEAIMSNDKKALRKLLDKYPIFKTGGGF